jgi:hypothetical protein
LSAGDTPRAGIIPADERKAWDISADNAATFRDLRASLEASPGLFKPVQRPRVAGVNLPAALVAEACRHRDAVVPTRHFGSALSRLPNVRFVEWLAILLAFALCRYARL